MLRSGLKLVSVWVLTTTCVAVVRAEDRPVDRDVSFSRDVKPILSARCFACHGPDVARRKSGLRLDTRAGLLATPGLVTAGRPEESELVERITTADHEARMPPRPGEPLSAEQIAMIRRWIEQGATWQEHWSYLKLVRPPVPGCGPDDAGRGPVDAFLLASSRRAGVTPAPEADRVTLIRRLSFDLTGLPPAPGDVDAFVSDPRPDAYDRLVDRLLGSPHFGERMAQFWLDLVRYADTVGYSTDAPMNVWAYRDYVIRGFNQNLPFDRFTMEQLAGDLLPGADDGVLFGSGYNRLLQTTEEGGAQAVEYMARYAADRVRNASTVWLGATLGCAQCHDHKSDPFTQRDFYSLAAFFADIQEAPGGQREPGKPIVDERQAHELEALDGEIAGLKRQIAERTPETTSRQAAWEARKRAEPGAAWRRLVPEAVRVSGDAAIQTRPAGILVAATHSNSVDDYYVSVRTGPGSLTGVRVEALADDGLPQGGPGTAPDGNFLLTDFKVSAAPNLPLLLELPIDEKQPAADTRWAIPTFAVIGAVLGLAAGGAGGLRLRSSRATLRGSLAGLVLGATAGAAAAWLLPPTYEMAIAPVIRPGRKALLARLFIHAGLGGAVGLAAGIAFALHSQKRRRLIALSWGLTAALFLAVLYLAVGEERPVPIASVVADFAEDGHAASAAIDGRTDTGWGILPATARPHSAVFEFAEHIGYVFGTRMTIALSFHDRLPQRFIGRFRLSVATSPEPASTWVPEDLRQTLALPRSDRTAKQAEAVAEFFRSIDGDLKPARDRLASLYKRRAELLASLPSSMVTMAGRPHPTRILPRGDWMDATGSIVGPAVPAVLPPLEVQGRRPTRLDLARWLTSTENPLTARVFVNRLWALYFGRGISDNLDDLGSQGKWPTHPELLDWLAVEFQESGWDMKHLIRQIVGSQAYRRSARADRDSKHDPANRYFARQASFRLDAEMVRDNALSISGLLSRRVGGPSVMPYQPAGYWDQLSYPLRTYQHDHGESQYRRGLYMHWQRSFLHPSLLAFDAPSREECTAGRARSDTPLQALVLLNDPTYVEAARALAARVLKEGGGSTQDRIVWAFRTAVSRAPAAEEARIVALLLEKHANEYAQDRAAASALLKVGEFPAADDVDAGLLAAWTSVARVLLNLGESVTRP